MTPRAKDVKAEAARRLMERRLAEDWSEEDQAKLDAWLQDSPANLIAYVRLEAAWSRTDRLVVLRDPASEADAPARAARTLMLQIAAAIGAVAIIGAGAATLFARPGGRVFSTPVGGHEVVSFADGTRIELNTNTELRADMTSASRTIWLERGEAYFQVKHDPAHPFTVMVGKQRITDLGTKFLVRRDASKTQVSLVDGSIRMGADGRKQEVLKPGDVAIATAGSLSVKKAPEAITNELSWRKGLVVFKHTTLAEAAAEFNRYNQTKLVIANEATGRLKIYGTFRVQDATLFAQVVQDVLGLRLEADAGEIVISR